jgi:YD repeat-containing protein
VEIETSLPTTGPYTITVFDYGNNDTGRYELSWQRANNPCTPVSLTCGTVMEKGALTSGAAIDAFSINAVEDDMLTIRLRSTTDRFTAHARLYDSLGNRLGSSTSEIPIKISNTGRYFLLVTYSSGRLLKGDYQLIWQRSKNPCGASRIVECITLKGALKNQGDLIPYTFAGIAGHTAVFTVEGITTNVSPQMELYDPNGTRIASSSGLLRRNLDKTGTHTVFVFAGSGDEVGDYSLSLGNIRVRLLSPNGGEALFAGSNYTIQWISAGDNPRISTHQIRLSTDGGTSYSTIIASGLSGSAQSYSWTVPANVKTTKARLRISARDAGDRGCDDSSDSNFAMLGLSSTKSILYKYDELNRLTEARYEGNATLRYTYDETGNRLRQEIIADGVPRLDIQMSKSSYTNGDLVTASEFRITNPSSSSVAVRVMLTLAFPGGSITLLDIGADGQFSLPPNLNVNLGPLQFFSVTSSFARGNYGVNSRMEDPKTARVISEDLNPFEIK